MESTASSEHNVRVLGVFLGREREEGGGPPLRKGGQYYDDKWKSNSLDLNSFYRVKEKRAFVCVLYTSSS